MVFSCDCRRLHNVTEPHPFAFALTPRTRLRCALRALFKWICIKNKYEHTRTGNRRELMIDRMFRTFACRTGHHSAARTSAHMHIWGPGRQGGGRTTTAPGTCRRLRTF